MAGLDGRRSRRSAGVALRDVCRFLHIDRGDLFDVRHVTERHDRCRQGSGARGAYLPCSLAAGGRGSSAGATVGKEGEFGAYGGDRLRRDLRHQHRLPDTRLGQSAPERVDDG